MAVPAPDRALLDLVEHTGPCRPSEHESAHVSRLLGRSEMVELQDAHIVLAAVDAGMGSQIGDQPLIVARLLSEAPPMGLLDVVASVPGVVSSPIGPATEEAHGAAARGPVRAPRELVQRLLNATLRTDLGHGARLAFRHPNWLAVLLMWQFTQRTSHFSISARTRCGGADDHLSHDTVLAFPRTWSNSSTIGSVSLQSTHGCWSRYSRTNRAFRSR